MWIGSRRFSRLEGRSESFCLSLRSMPPKAGEGGELHLTLNVKGNRCAHYPLPDPLPLAGEGAKLNHPARVFA